MGAELRAVGRFQHLKTSDETYKKLTQSGFVVPKKLVGLHTNLAENKTFDQIAFKADVLGRRLNAAKGGTVPFHKKLYTDDQEKEYADAMGAPYRAKDKKKRTQHYKRWRTYQMSDHLPLWISIDIDFTRGFLANQMRGKRPEKRARR